jgi:hypothetical protein
MRRRTNARFEMFLPLLLHFLSIMSSKYCWCCLQKRLLSCFLSNSSNPPVLPAGQVLTWGIWGVSPKERGVAILHFNGTKSVVFQDRELDYTYRKCIVIIFLSATGPDPYNLIRGTVYTKASGHWTCSRGGWGAGPPGRRRPTGFEDW